MTTRPRILLTNPMHEAVQADYAHRVDLVVAPDTSADTLRRLVADADGVIVRSLLPDDIFEHAPRLRAVVRHGVGLDMIPVERATDRGIPVANLPGSNTQSVVEYCLAAMLHFRRPLAKIDMGLRSEGWGPARAMSNSATELARTVCGIVGVGAIGGGVARMAQHLGMRVFGLTRDPSRLPEHVTPKTRDELFAESDVVVLCCPLTSQTRHLVDASAIERMKPTAVLINVARGPVVDTAAVIKALHEGRLAGAALDVHDHHPLRGDEPIFDAPRLLLTPHVAAVTESSMRVMSEGSVDLMTALLAGRRHPNVCNPEVFDRPRIQP